jgi:hypothetical protein
MYAPDPDKIKRDAIVVCALVCAYVAIHFIVALHPLFR